MEETILAKRHRCEYGNRGDRAPTMGCTFWATGAPKRKRCARCGGGFVVELGAWVTGSDYSAEGVVSRHRTEAQAHRYSDTHRTDELVWYFRAETAHHA